MNKLTATAERCLGGDRDELVSVTEAASRLGGLSKHTIYGWLSQGKLARTKVGSRTMIRVSELLKMIEEEHD